MSDIVIALEITVLGMGLVFAALLLLWWMMALLTNVTAEKETPAKAAAPDSAEVTVAEQEEELKARAAAIAVATAMAEHQLSQTHPLPLPPTTLVSAWQLGLRSRQLSQKGIPITRNPRKVG